MALNFINTFDGTMEHYGSSHWLLVVYDDW